MGLQSSELDVQGQGFKPLVHVTPCYAAKCNINAECNKNRRKM